MTETETLSGTDGRAHYGGVSDSPTTGFRWRRRSDGVCATVAHRSSSSGVN